MKEKHGSLWPFHLVSGLISNPGGFGWVRLASYVAET